MTCSLFSTAADYCNNIDVNVINQTTTLEIPVKVEKQIIEILLRF